MRTARRWVGRWTTASSDGARRAALAECRARGGFGCILRAWGCNGPAVEEALRLDRPARRQIQRGLQAAGFDPGGADGLFGPRTRAAIRRWQTSRGARATGYLDRASVAALRPSPVAPRTFRDRADAAEDDAGSLREGASAAQRQGELRESLRRLVQGLAEPAPGDPGAGTATSVAEPWPLPERDLPAAPPAPRRVGAFASGYVPDTGGIHLGFAVDQPSAEDARQRALQDCSGFSTGDPGCSVVTEFEHCVAAAYDPSFNGVWSAIFGWSAGANENDVRRSALESCRAQGGARCREDNVVSRCNGRE